METFAVIVVVNLREVVFQKLLMATGPKLYDSSRGGTRCSPSSQAELMAKTSNNISYSEEQGALLACHKEVDSLVNWFLSYPSFLVSLISLKS